jgi:integrase
LDALLEEDRAIWATDFYAGLRNGELQALRVENIELFDTWGLLHVEGSWDKVEGQVETKSKAGTRVVPICEQLYTILDEYLVKLGRSEGLAVGQTATQPYSYNAVRERAERVWRRAGIEPSDFHLHEGRHTFKAFLEATDIRDSRIDRYMGHANHSVQGRYSHQLDAQYLDDAKALSEYLRLAHTPSRVAQVRTSRAPVSTS